MAGALFRQKQHVQLDNVHINILENIQRGVSTSKIVHLHHVAVLMKRLHHFIRLCMIAHNRGLCDFHSQILDRHIMTEADRLQLLHKIGLKNVIPGKICRDGNKRQLFVDAFAQKDTDLFKHIQIQLRNEPVLLK